MDDTAHNDSDSEFLLFMVALIESEKKEVSEPFFQWLFHPPPLWHSNWNECNMKVLPKHSPGVSAARHVRAEIINLMGIR